MNIINQTAIIDFKKSFLEDTKFVIQFTFLLSLILFLSLYLIFQSFTIVNRIAVDSSADRKIFQREIIANSSLNDLDLSGINIVKKKEIVKKDVPQIIEKKQKEITVAKINKPLVEKKVENKKPKFIIESDIVPNSVKYIKNRFYATNSTVYSVMLAKKYFDMKQYSKAMKWAFITNELDSTNEYSWILYAKSKAKLNRKDEAINILLSYLKDHDSLKVQSLLNQLKQGV